MRAMRPTAAWRTACSVCAPMKRWRASIGCSSNRHIPWKKFSRARQRVGAVVVYAGQAAAVFEPRGAPGPRGTGCSTPRSRMRSCMRRCGISCRTFRRAAWQLGGFQASRHGVLPHPLRLDVGETVAKQRELEERYYTSTMLEIPAFAWWPSSIVVTRRRSRGTQRISDLRLRHACWPCRRDSDAHI